MNFCCCTRLTGNLYSKPKSKTFFFSLSEPPLNLGSALSVPSNLSADQCTSTIYSLEYNKTLLFTCKSCAPCPPFNLAVAAFGACLTAFLYALIMKQPQGVFVALQQQANEISRNPEGPLTTRDIPARKHAGLQHRWEFDGINTTFQRFRCCSRSQIKIDHQMSFNKITAAEDANSDTAARTNANTQMCVVAN